MVQSRAEPPVCSDLRLGSEQTSGVAVILTVPLLTEYVECLSLCSDSDKLVFLLNGWTTAVNHQGLVIENRVMATKVEVEDRPLWAGSFCMLSFAFFFSYRGTGTHPFCYGDGKVNSLTEMFFERNDFNYNYHNLSKKQQTRRQMGFQVNCFLVLWPGNNFKRHIKLFAQQSHQKKKMQIGALPVLHPAKCFLSDQPFKLLVPDHIWQWQWIIQQYFLLLFIGLCVIFLWGHCRPDWEGPCGPAPSPQAGLLPMCGPLRVLTKLEVQPCVSAQFETIT